MHIDTYIHIHTTYVLLIHIHIPTYIYTTAVPCTISAIHKVRPVDTTSDMLEKTHTHIYVGI